MKTKDIKSITIIGKRWFDKINGNTYFSSVGLINGIPVLWVKFRYGYENQYMYDTFRAMAEDGFIEGIPERYELRNFCQDNNIAFYYTAADVARRKDL